MAYDEAMERAATPDPSAPEFMKFVESSTGSISKAKSCSRSSNVTSYIGSELFEPVILGSADVVAGYSERSGAKMLLDGVLL